MPRSLWNSRDRQELLGRLERLTPDTVPLWGSFNAMRMVTHLTEWFRMATGEIKSQPRNSMMRHPPMRQLIVYWMPWPHGVPTAPELLSREATGWEEELSDLRERLKDCEKLKSTKQWPVHPAFGRMTTSEWGVLGYRHTDHHLKQFGV